MKHQVSIKVYMDDDLYKYYNSIEGGRKGQVVRDALKLYRDLNSISPARTLVEVKAEMREGFERIEKLLGQSYVRVESTEGAPDMADMFDGFVQIVEEE